MAPLAAPARQTHQQPQLVAGVQLLGQYQGSGLTEPPYLIRHPDGRVLQVSRLLFLVAEQLDGRRNLLQLSKAVTSRFGRVVSPENIAFLVREKLGPLGLLPHQSKQAPAPRPVLGLRLRRTLLPAQAVARVTGALQVLFRPLAVVAVLAALAGVDVWLLFWHGLGRGFEQALLQPTTFLLVFALLIASAAFHELGHATACHYGGAKPGAIGAALYLVWPAFFSEVTDSYALSRSERLRTDLGGVYFNGVFVVAVASVYFASGFEALLLFIAVQHLQIALQFMPFVRLDGYYVVSDLAGVPDLFARLRPVLTSLIPGRAQPPELAELQPGARRLITAWVWVTAPALAVAAVVLVIHLPRVWRDAAGSLVLHVGALVDSVAAGDAMGAVLAAINTSILVFPAVGLGLSLLVILARLARWANGFRRSRPAGTLPGHPPPSGNAPSLETSGGESPHPDTRRRPLPTVPPLSIGSLPAPARPGLPPPRRGSVSGPVWSVVHGARTARASLRRPY